MENKPNKKPNILEIESQREELINKVLSAASNISMVHLYFEFFNKILLYHSPNLTEVFLKEFIDDYISSIANFDVWGTEPEKTKAILSQLTKLIELSFVADRFSVLKFEIVRIGKQLEKLERLLKERDEDEDEDKEHKAFFPLINKEAAEGFYGILESVTVVINKADDDKFIIVPSEKEIEKKILEQTKTSWYAALELSKVYIKKTYKYHEVIISFDKKQGFYEGSSLGIALTVSFLEQLLKFYNPTYFIKIKERTAFTGGVTKEGKVLSCGEEIIKQKVKAVFFSEMNSFVVAKDDEIPARKQLLELQKEYPNRNLKLIPVEDINDVLNRRDVVDIRKQKLVVRTGKFVRRNWVSAVVTVLLAILFAYLFVMDFDDNPAILENNGTTLYVKNNNGKVLWTRNKMDGEGINSESYLKSVQKIIDINNDGINEILLAGEPLESLNNKEDLGRIVCTDFKGDEIWEYKFKDTVSTITEKLSPNYKIWMIDTLTIDEHKFLFAISQNHQSFSSAIFCLDLKTGKRIAGTLWNAGFIIKGIVVDLDSDGNKEIVAICHNNGFEAPAIFAVDVRKLNGFNPAPQNYKLVGKSNAELKRYILLPKTDFTNYYNENRLGVLANYLGFRDDLKKIFFGSIEGNSSGESGEVWYYLDRNLKDFDIVMGEDLRIKRDSLVGRGILSYPLTDTYKYREILKSKILYWKNGKWVKREELD